MDVLAARLPIGAASAPAAAVTADPDRELAERFWGGDRAAFDQIVRRHQRAIWHLVRRYVKRDADASDVTQLAFVRAYRGLATFRGAATVRSWLYRIAINCALSWLRDHRREEPAELAEDALTDANPAPARLATGEDNARLRAAVAKLPPKQKLVLELRVFDDLSFKEVAELAECSENTAKVNFHYAVKRLRDILGGIEKQSRPPYQIRSTSSSSGSIEDGAGERKIPGPGGEHAP